MSLPDYLLDPPDIEEQCSIHKLYYDIHKGCPACEDDEIDRQYDERFGLGNTLTIEDVPPYETQ